MSARSVLRAAAAVPAMVVSAAPVAVCPACWPAYAGALSALGLGGALQGRGLVALVALALAVALAALLWKARTRRGYGPAALGAIAAAAILLGKFALASGPLTWTGAALLAAASAWNAWPPRASARHGGACPHCVPAGQEPSNIVHPSRDEGDTP